MFLGGTGIYQFILGKIHFTPLKYPPICTFTSKVSNVTLYPLPKKLSNCGNSTHLAFLFPKCPHHKFYFLKKNIQKKCWGGRTTPRPNGVADDHLGGGSAAPWANRSIFHFWVFGPREAEPPWAIEHGSVAPQTSQPRVVEPP